MKKNIPVLISILIAITMVAQKPLFTETDIPNLVKKLSVEQKARLLVGSKGSNVAPSHLTPGAAGWTYAIPELGIPSVNLADGPVGPRINPMPWITTRVVYDDFGLPHEEVVTDDTDNSGASNSSRLTQWCTAFPSTTALAATFDPMAARRQGEIMGDEAAAYGVDVLLTPGINIMRNPLCGRNFEYYSEDPLLTGVLATELVKGVQSRGVGTSLKHFVANNQQTGKKVNDAIMSQRALREIYLPAFERVVREAKPWTVMGSYNKIAGEFTQTNRELTKRLLRDEWGFDGLVLTDWTVRRPTADLLNAQAALMMPGEEEIVQEIIECVNNGSVTMETLDACVTDVLRMVAKTLSTRGWKCSQPDLAANAAYSRQLGAEAMVLLKNNDRLLPLAAGSKIALFGTSAYQSIAGGTGSSNVNKRYVVDIDSGLIAAGYKVDESLARLYRSYNQTQAELNDAHPGCPEWQKISYHRPVIDEMSVAGASTLLRNRVAQNDAAVVVIGRKSGETSDRRVANDFNLSATEKELIKKVCDVFHAQNKPVVVVLNVCGTVETASWNDLPDAIVLAWFPGQECGNAVADVISGKVNPSGRLPMTWPVSYYDLSTASNYPYVGQTEGRNFDYTFYEEDIWLGYRYFDKAHRKVAYPFGYGLSYTDFEYLNPKIRRSGDKTTVEVTVRNSGKYPGREVVQLYVSAPQDGNLPKPLSELRGFAKTAELQPGQSEKVTITVKDSDLASFNADKSQWETEAGRYQAHFGRSAGDFLVSLPFEIKKASYRKVEDLLRPVEKARTMRMISATPSPTDNMSWHEVSEFKMLGRAYPDSLPLYSRVPAFLKSTTRDALYDLGQNTAGMAIRFRSDSPRFALDWQSLNSDNSTNMAVMATRGADLYWLTPEGEWRFLAPARPMGDPTTWLIIDNMEPQMREYMLHLPLYDGLKFCKIGIAPESVIENPQIESPRADVKPIVIYGSSIQQGATASRPGMAASNIIRRDLDIETINLGFSANAHIDYEIAEMMADVDASVYVLDFVPNALPWEIEEKTEKFVKILRDRRPDVPLIFVECPAFTHTQLDKTSSAYYNDSKNQAIKKVYDKMVAEGLDNTFYLTADKILPADGDGSSDSIHFNDYGFRYFAHALTGLLKQALNISN